MVQIFGCTIKSCYLCQCFSKTPKQEAKESRVANFATYQISSLAKLMIRLYFTKFLTRKISKDERKVNS